MSADKARKRSVGEAFSRMDPDVRTYFQRTLRELTDIKEAIDKVLAVAITDPAGVITYVNDRFCQLYKYPREEVLGKTHRILKTGEHPKSFYQRLWNTISRGRIFEGEIKNRAKDGSEHWAYVVIVPFMNVEEKPYQYVSFRTDISAIKQAETERLKLLKAEADLQARDRFVSMAAHELKTPITSLQMILELLVKQFKIAPNSPEQFHQIDQLLNTAIFQTGRLTMITNDLLDVSRMAAGKLLLKRDLLDLGEMVKAIIENSKTDFDVAQCKVDLKIQNHIAGMWDKVRLEQVVINLISNAMKYGQGKPIHISVEADAKTAKIIVQDHGIGIPKNFQRRLFQRFERSDAAEHFKGLGLGLWITNQIIDEHRGHIHVESEEGHGSTFTVELPIQVDPPSAPPIRQPANL